MARKPVQTFHPLAVAKSLEAQNEAIGMLLGKVAMLETFKGDMPERLQPLFSEIHADVQRVRALLWPEDGE